MLEFGTHAVTAGETVQNKDVVILPAPAPGARSTTLSSATVPAGFVLFPPTSASRLQPTVPECGAPRGGRTPAYGRHAGGGVVMSGNAHSGL